MTYSRKGLTGGGAAIVILLASIGLVDAQVAVSRGFNPWTGRAYRNVAVRNPWTGRVARGGAVIDPWTGAMVRGGRVYDPWTGRTAAVGVAYNPWTGRSRWGANTWRGW
jgi:hypothetical protein